VTDLPILCVSPVGPWPWLGPLLAALRRYVLPVLWITSPLSVMGPMAYFNTGSEFDVYECLSPNAAI